MDVPDFIQVFDPVFGGWNYKFATLGVEEIEVGAVLVGVLEHFSVFLF